MIPTLASVLDFQLQSGQDGRSPQQQLLDYLRTKRLLLLLDNFEHLLSPPLAPPNESDVLPASPPMGGIGGGEALVAEILRVAPDVQILVTSRERLHLHSEQVCPIQGLEFPDGETTSPNGEGSPDGEGEEATEYTAVQLFLQSARRNQPDFALQTSDSLPHLAHICRLVAGMPLAIELAGCLGRHVAPGGNRG